jgi:hypothetical protein
MNDDSGNIAWHAPEVIGEILYNVPQLQKDYLPILTSFVNMYPFQEGTHWALYRLAQKYPNCLKDYLQTMIHSLQAENPQVRAYAAATLGLITDSNKLVNSLHLLLKDYHRVSFYDFTGGQFVHSTLRDIALNALQIINEHTL